MAAAERRAAGQILLTIVVFGTLVALVAVSLVLIWEVAARPFELLFGID